MIAYRVWLHPAEPVPDCPVSWGGWAMRRLEVVHVNQEALAEFSSMHHCTGALVEWNGG